jgi:hypothetical protein
MHASGTPPHRLVLQLAAGLHASVLVALVTGCHQDGAGAQEPGRDSGNLPGVMRPVEMAQPPPTASSAQPMPAASAAARPKEPSKPPVVIAE